MAKKKTTDDLKVGGNYRAFDPEASNKFDYQTPLEYDDYVYPEKKPLTAADAPEIDLPYQLYGQSGGTQVGDYPELRLKGKPTAQQKRDAKYEAAGWDNYWKYNPDGSLRITPQEASAADLDTSTPDTGASAEDPWKPWNDRMEEIYSQLANLPDYPTLGKFQGPEFSYDYRQDPAYQQYREQYIRNGQLAMKDTMGQAAGLTGGYGSSYAQNAGQQAYQGYMNQLNAVVPQLYKDAYGRYSDDYTRQYQEYKDDYTARVNAYNNQVDAVKTLASLINQDRQMSLNERKQDFDEQKYQDALDFSGGLSVDDYVNLAKNGLWIDENGGIYQQPAGSNLSVSDQLKLRENELVYDDNGNLVQDTNNINGKSIGQLKDAVSSALDKYKDKKWDVDKRRRRVLEDLADEGYTEKQMQYIEELLGEYLSYLA